MKKTFMAPSVEVVKLNPTDIIATSDINVGGEGEFDARSSEDWELFDEE